MNPLIAALGVIAIVVVLCAGFSVLVALGALVEWNENEERRE